MLRDAAEFKIVKLVEKNRIADAVDDLDKFVKDYPQQGAVLTEFVVSKIRERLLERRGLATDAQAQAELQSLRKAYLDFARLLHDRAVAAKRSADDMYKLQQWLAEALLENGQADEALAIFSTKLMPVLKSRVDAENAAIDKQVEQLKRDLAAISTDTDRVKKKAAEFDELLSSKGIDTKGPVADMVRMAKQYLDKADANKPEDIEYRRKNLVAQLGAGYDKFGRFLRDRVESDAAVPLGMARAQAAKGDFDKAARLYRQVVQGFEKVKTRFPRNYWEAMVEYCECVAAGYGKDAKVMRDLRAYMMDVKSASQGMAGFEARFEAALAKTGPGPAAPVSSPAAPTSAP
jgi:tetratricopeptide (TPR) repeat protein